MSAVKNDLNLTVTRVFDAPVDLVWQAFTRPEHLVHFWVPQGFNAPMIQSLDVRPGGKWRIYMPAKDGTHCTAYGVYREVEPNELLSWDDYCDDNEGNFFHKAFVAMAFESLGKKTRITIRARLEPPADRDPKWTIAFMEQGWSGGWADNLEKLAGYLPQSSTADREVVISREYEAPRALVWEAFTDLKHVQHWWGPNGFTTTTKERNVAPGGTWRFIMHGPDGTDYPNLVTYLVVQKPGKLVYAHGSGPESVEFYTTVTFEELAPKRTKLTLRAVFVSAEARRMSVEKSGAIEGGKQTLARLAAHLETMR